MSFTIISCVPELVIQSGVVVFEDNTSEHLVRVVDSHEGPARQVQHCVVSYPFSLFEFPMFGTGDSQKSAMTNMLADFEKNKGRDDSRAERYITIDVGDSPVNVPILKIVDDFYCIGKPSLLVRETLILKDGKHQAVFGLFEESMVVSVEIKDLQSDLDRYKRKLDVVNEYPQPIVCFSDLDSALDLLTETNERLSA